MSLRTKIALREQMRGLKMLIVDEFSMVGLTALDKLDRNLRNIFEIQLPFAGLDIIFSGDFMQLPPIGDPGLFLDLDQPGRATWLAIPNVVILQRSHRHANDAAYSELLSRLRVGESTDEDLRTINDCETRCDKCLVPDLERFAAGHPQLMCAVFTNLETDRINKARLEHTQEIIVCIPAQHATTIGEDVGRTNAKYP